MITLKIPQFLIWLLSVQTCWSAPKSGGGVDRSVKFPSSDSIKAAKMFLDETPVFDGYENNDKKNYVPLGKLL